MVKTTISESGSMKGYKFKEWLKRNKETVKALIVAGVGIAVFFIPQIESVSLSAGIASVVAIITKLLVDGIDFWVSDVEIKK